MKKKLHMGRDKMNSLTLLSPQHHINYHANATLTVMYIITSPIYISSNPITPPDQLMTWKNVQFF